MRLLRLLHFLCLVLAVVIAGSLYAIPRTDWPPFLILLGAAAILPLIGSQVLSRAHLASLRRKHKELEGKALLDDLAAQWRDTNDLTTRISALQNELANAEQGATILSALLGIGALVGLIAHLGLPQTQDAELRPPKLQAPANPPPIAFSATPKSFQSDAVAASSAVLALRTNNSSGTAIDLPSEERVQPDPTPVSLPHSGAAMPAMTAPPRAAPSPRRRRPTSTATTSPASSDALSSTAEALTKIVPGPFTSDIRQPTPASNSNHLGAPQSS